MKRHFEKLSALIAILLFSAKGRAVELTVQSREKVSTVIAELETYSVSQPEIFNHILRMNKLDLEMALNVDLSIGEYGEIIRVIHQLKAVDVMMEYVPLDRMHLATQEYAEK